MSLESDVKWDLFFLINESWYKFISLLFNKPSNDSDSTPGNKELIEYIWVYISRCEFIKKGK